MTNREWLESLSDEEFAEVLNDSYCEAMERFCCGVWCTNICFEYNSKDEQTADWLKMEHEEA